MKAFFSLLVLVFLLLPRLSYADWSIGIGVGGGDRWHDDQWHRQPHYGWHDHPGWGYHVHFLPAGYATIWVGGARYYYDDGLYYTYVGNGDYVLVDPPVGAFVAAIPPDFAAIVVNGRTYYTNGGVYYILTRHHGYKVVAAPVRYAQPQVVTTVTTMPPPPPAQDTFTVNVPNSNGSYTPITIRRSGNGYVGPQGEFYAAFPSVAQLRAMYAK
jgi:hypothetical protein